MSPKDAAKHEAFRAAMVGGRSVAQAAKEAGVPERTARRWWADPATKAAVRSMRGDAIEQAVGMLSVAALLAVKVLVKVASADDEPAPVRLQAARAILSHLAELRASEMLAAEVEDLRKLVESRPNVIGGAA